MSDVCNIPMNGGTLTPTGILVETRTVNEAWQEWFDMFHKQAEAGKNDPSRDGAVVAECLNAITVINDPTRNIITSDDRRMPMRYAVGELLWYLSGSNRLKDISVFSKVWERMSDDGVTVNSAYGQRIFERFGFDQFEYVVEALTKNPLSRQAVIHIKDAEDYNTFPTKDVPCTVALQYLIRDGKLHATTYMRSNDLWTGFPYDVFSFTCFQILLAFRLGVDIGTYTHFAGSLHLYERSLDEWREKHSAHCDGGACPIPVMGGPSPQQVIGGTGGNSANDLFPNPVR